MADFMGVEIIIIFALILANGFFAASEIAIVSARRGRLQQQADLALRVGGDSGLLPLDAGLVSATNQF